MLDVPRQQQLIHHVEGQQPCHAVIGKALPRFGKREEEEAPGVTHEALVVGLRRRCYDTDHRQLSVAGGRDPEFQHGLGVFQGLGKATSACL